MPEVLTDLCERNRHSEIFRKEFSDLGGGAVVPRSQAAEHSTQKDLNSYFLIIHSSKAPYQCSQEGQPNIHLDTHIPGQWSVGRPVGDADMGTPCQKIARQ